MSSIQEIKDKYFKTGYNPTEKQFEKDLKELTEEAVRGFVEDMFVPTGRESESEERLRKEQKEAMLSSVEQYLKYRKEKA